MADHWACKACAAWVTVSQRPTHCPRCGSPDIEEADNLELP